MTNNVLFSDPLFTFSHAQALPLSVYMFEVLADLQAPVSTLLCMFFWVV